MTTRSAHPNTYLRTTILVTILFILIQGSFNITTIAQSRLYLQHQYKSYRQKNISLKREFKFQTVDTIYYRCRIISFSDSTLSLTSKYSEENIEIAIADILYLEKKKKYGFFDFTATIGLIGLSITPIIWATEGNEAALEMLVGAGTFIGFSMPFIFIRDIGRKKDLKNKWMICLWHT